MSKLSTGQPNTLKSWRENCVAVFGEDSRAVTYIDSKIKESPNGENEKVIADEVMFLRVLMRLHNGNAS